MPKTLEQGGLVCQGDGGEVFGAAVAAGLKHGHGIGAQVDDAATGFALAHWPGHGHARHAEFALNLIQNVQRLAHFAVHLVDKGDDGRVALAANLDQAAGLRFNAVGRVNHHQGRIHGGEHAVGVLREVFVAGGVQQVDDVVAVHHLHHRRGHRNTPLLLNLHPVRRGVACGFAGLDRACDLDRTRKQQELLSQRGFTRVGVGNDGKSAAAACFRGVSHKCLQLSQTLSVNCTAHSLAITVINFPAFRESIT